MQFESRIVNGQRASSASKEFTANKVRRGGTLQCCECATQVRQIVPYSAVATYRQRRACHSPGSASWTTEQRNGRSTAACSHSPGQPAPLHCRTCPFAERSPLSELAEPRLCQQRSNEATCRIVMDCSVAWQAGPFSRKTAVATDSAPKPYNVEIPKDASAATR